MLLAVLLLLAPDTYDLRYRFTKGMSYEETTKRSYDVTQGEGEKRERMASSSEETLVRTIADVDRTEHPTIERVEVLKFSRTIVAHPVERPGVVVDPVEGKAFVWRRLEERWGLFDGERDVTERFDRLVERLKTWRDARMPKTPVAVGGTWEVTAQTYLETAGQPVPPGVEGVAVFKLEKVEEGVATISFRFVAKLVAEGSQEWDQKGTIRFDVAKGRDLDWEAEGTVRLLGKPGAEGTFRMSRKVTYR